jgi:hypothetical protein
VWVGPLCCSVRWPYQWNDAKSCWSFEVVFCVDVNQLSQLRSSLGCKGLRVPTVLMMRHTRQVLEQADLPMLNSPATQHSLAAKVQEAAGDVPSIAAPK